MASNAQRLSPGRIRVSTPGSGVRAANEVPHGAQYVPPRPEFDSEPQLTRVTAPDPSLLAMTRGHDRRGRARTRPFAWFLLGAMCGALAMWLAIGDVQRDVVTMRIAIAETLRALRTHPASEGASAPPTPAAVASAPSAEPIPTVDVSALPRATPPAPPPSPPPTAAPDLASAPGPR